MDKEARSRIGHIRSTLMGHERDKLEKDTEKLKSIRMANPDLALAYDMKEAFFGMCLQVGKDATRVYFKKLVEVGFGGGLQGVRIEGGQSER